VEPSYELAVFGGHRDAGYFSNYLTTTAAGGFFTSGRFLQLVPQLARQQPMIRYATCAIGAMCVALESNSLFEADYENAVQNYNRSLSTITQSPLTNENMLYIMLCATLFQIFEYLLGNRQTSTTHFKHRHNLAEQYLSQKYEDAEKSSKSPTLTPLEMELIAAFYEMSGHPWNYKSIPTINVSGELPWCCRSRKYKYIVEDMPLQFKDLPEARFWWEAVHHFVKHQSPLTAGLIALKEKDKIPLSKRHDISSEDFMLKLDPEANITVQECDATIKRWHERFLPLYEHAQSRNSQNFTNYLQALTLEVLFLLVKADIDLCCGNDCDAVGGKEKLESLFREIIRISQYLIRSSMSRSKLSISIEIGYGFVWPVIIIAHRSSNPKIWGEVVELMATAFAMPKLMQRAMQNQEFDVPT
jgi:hypothetical protein